MGKRGALVFCKVLAAAYGVTVLLLLGAALLLQQLGLGEGQVRLLITAVYGVSCLLFGFLWGKLRGRRRLLWGLLCGAVYFGLLFLLGLPFGGLYRSFWDGVKVLALCLAFGGAGGAFS